MRALLDACVLYPTLLRRILLVTAGTGAFRPLWSARILEEWRRAVLRDDPGDAAAVEGEIAALRAGWPEAEIAPAPDAEADLSLPDPDDRHVLAAAIAGGAEAIVTRNLKDFPGRTLGRHGIVPRHPDSLLVEAHAAAPGDLAPALRPILAAARRATGQDDRAVLKRAGLPRLAKAWTRGG